MKLVFDSYDEISRICEYLQGIYPADIVITLDDLIDARDREDVDNIPLPWNHDSYHPLLSLATPRMPIVIIDESVDNEVSMTVNKKVDKWVNKKDDKSTDIKPSQNCVTSRYWIRLAEQLGFQAQLIWTESEKRTNTFFAFSINNKKG